MGRAAGAVIADAQDDGVVARVQTDAGRCRMCVFRNVGQSFGGDVVDGGLHRRRETRRDVCLEGDGEMCVIDEDLEGGSKAPVGEHSGVDPTGQLSELVDRKLELLRRLGQQVLGLGGVVRKLKPGQPQRQRE